MRASEPKPELQAYFADRSYTLKIAFFAYQVNFLKPSQIDSLTILLHCSRVFLIRKSHLYEKFAKN